MAVLLLSVSGVAKLFKRSVALRRFVSKRGRERRPWQTDVAASEVYY